MKAISHAICHLPRCPSDTKLRLLGGRLSGELGGVTGVPSTARAWSATAAKKDRAQPDCPPHRHRMAAKCPGRHSAVTPHPQSGGCLFK